MKNYSDIFAHIDNIEKQRINEIKNVLNLAFEEAGSKTIGLPEWMRQAFDHSDSACELPNTYASYRHGGAWCRMYCIIRETNDNENNPYTYYADGIENEEYSQEWIDGIEVTINEAFEFVRFYIESFIDNQLKELRNAIQSCERIGDIGIRIDEWCEEYGYDRDYIEDSEVMEWYGQFIDKA